MIVEILRKMTLLVASGTLFVFVHFLSFASAHDQIPGSPQSGPIALVGGTIHVVDGDRIDKGTVVFDGGKITHIFGGSKIDFSRAKLAPGRHHLELTLIFGGTKLIIPEAWDVKVEVTSVFGGFSDKRIRSIVVADTDRSLVITGSSIFGGGEIVNYH